MKTHEHTAAPTPALDGAGPSDAAAPRTYRRPEIYSLGSLEQVQAYYHGRFRDGPRSSYWYDG